MKGFLWEREKFPNRVLLWHAMARERVGAYHRVGSSEALRGLEENILLCFALL
jgi:hypothetical protein